MLFLTSAGLLSTSEDRARVFTDHFEAVSASSARGLYSPHQLASGGWAVVQRRANPERDWHPFRPLTEAEHQGFLGIEDVQAARISGGHAGDWRVAIIVEPATVQVHFASEDGDMTWGRFFERPGEQRAELAQALGRQLLRWFREAPRGARGWEALRGEFGLEQLT
jgi:hypothetical protein